MDRRSLEIRSGLREPEGAGPRQKDREMRKIDDREALLREAEVRRVAREARLRALGFEEVSDEQRRKNLALNIALLEWPK